MDIIYLVACTVYNLWCIWQT